MSDQNCPQPVDSFSRLPDIRDDGRPRLLVEKDAVDCRESSDGGRSSKIHQAFETGNLGGDSGSSDGLARGIATLMTRVIRDFDMKAEAASNSQGQLSRDLDRLTKELDKLLEDAPIAFSMQHAARISGVRRRVSSMNMTLTSIQRRLDHIDRMLPLGSPHELDRLLPTDG